MTVEATSGLVEGCPVTATLSFEDDCAESRTVTLATGDTSDAFDISARSNRAPELDCVCENFDAVCKVEEAELEGLCAGDDVTVDCSGGEITFEGADAECKDDGDLVCFNFTSTFEVFRVFVKGGGGRDTGNEYTWPCETFDSDDPASSEYDFETDQEYDGTLCANEHPKNAKQTRVSHVPFSVCAEDLD